MPPNQCPACGRFLRTSLVEGLAVGSVPCPGCGERLEAAMFGRSVAWDHDPLADWDHGVGPSEIAGWRLDEPPLPADGLVVLGSALVGGLLGLAFAEGRRGRAVAAGSVCGAVGGGLARRVWRLPG